MPSSSQNTTHINTKEMNDPDKQIISMGGFDITIAPSPSPLPKGKSKRSAEESIDVTESTSINSYDKSTMTDTSNNTDLSDISRRMKENNLFIAEKNAEITKIQEEIVEKAIENEQLLLDLLEFVESSAFKLAIMEQQKEEADAELQAEREHFAALSNDFTAAFSRLGDFHDRLLSFSEEEESPLHSSSGRPQAAPSNRFVTTKTLSGCKVWCFGSLYCACGYF